LSGDVVEFSSQIDLLGQQFVSALGAIKWMP
jgi:hypothetical protein